MLTSTLPFCLMLASGIVAQATPRHSHKTSHHCAPSEIGFQEAPLAATKQISFTFDDGPDGKLGKTDSLLDTLSALHIQATFFVCADNWTPVHSDTIAQKTIRRIVAEGHELGNHTSHHRHLPALRADEIAKEFKSTEDLVLSDAVLGRTHGPLTLLRAPFGQPFEADPVNKAWIGPILAEFGVHIGWNINSYDWACSDKKCVVDNVMRAIDAGQEGIILMHSNYQATIDAMPILVATLKHRGYSIVTVEHLLEEKYGATSQELTRHHKLECRDAMSK